MVRYSIAILLLISFGFLLTPSVSAQDTTAPIFVNTDQEQKRVGQPHDIIYYMSDGEFTDAEKDAEALYVYQRCDGNAIQRRLFDCSCVSGAFRNYRDNEELIPQSHIMSSIYNQKDTTCLNEPNIAGTTYEKCMNEAKYYYESNTQEENEQYCSCLANKTTNDFSKNPKLDLSYFNKVKAKASRFCHAVYRR